MPTSKAKIYKLTSSGEIPHRKYGNKLVFSRQELLRWMEEQAVPIKKVEGRF
ncbi:helix-turn-helix domain-containing protein [Alistipes sp.]|uniref:helix-turn-helix domain-containing protein n=1 Tax=Alistipes sp. TaxID=1872444 RepID=UPI003AB18A54